MPALVYRITEVLSAIVIELPLGTNLGLFHILWTLLSGRLLQSRGALIPALAATGLEPAAVRRAWAAFADGAWDISQLVAALQTVVRQEGRWHAQHFGGYRVVAVDTTGFFRPRLKNCATKHYLSQAGEALPAIPFGLIASVGAVAEPNGAPGAAGHARPQPHARPKPKWSAPCSAQTATQLAPDEAAVVDRGFTLGQTARGRGPALGQPCAAQLYRPAQPRCPRIVAGGVAPAGALWSARWPAHAKGTPWPPPHPIALKPCSSPGAPSRPIFGVSCACPRPRPPPLTFQCLVVRDPAYAEPWVLATNLPLAAADVLAFYHARWPVEQVPLTAKQLLGAQRQFVFADAARQRLPELALVRRQPVHVLGRHPPGPAHWFLGSHPASHRRALPAGARPTRYFKDGALAQATSQKGIGHWPFAQGYSGPSAFRAAYPGPRLAETRA